MYRDATVAVVVPAYNEEGFVGETIATIPGYVDRIYAVEDGSTDGTWEEICRTAERINAASASRNGFSRRVVPIRHDANRGVGGAIKTGYLAAREDGIDVTAVMGGDAQMQPELLEGVIRPVVEGEADYVKGNRLLNEAHQSGMPRFRYVGNRILTWLTRIASGYWTIGDPQNGYTAISLHALEEAGIEDMYEYYGYCNDLLVRLNVAGLRVVDVPRPANYGDEESHIAYRSYIPKVSGMLLRNYLWRLRTKHLYEGPYSMLALFAAAATTVLGGVVDTIRSDRSLLEALPRLLGSLLVGTVFLVGALLVDRDYEQHLDDRLDPSVTESPPTDGEASSAPVSTAVGDD
ncbi:glycosyltransferase family 2 protein [Haloarcula sp. JP-L23]|uniref:glycosyltransferase family 2 protein n=1 Tax=Haloarcula sp. JP-L23 TaxID=2716717 RepID=UPI00140F37E8|nr:glycosyltransferase family 2 protein [Haloarcula sp. JP-L23]